ncbi:MAG: hypothetical protein ABR532_05865 [Candidatus Dormibacteria bacterium]
MLTEATIKALRNDLGDDAVERLIRGETTLADEQERRAFVAGFEHGAGEPTGPHLESPGYSDREIRAWRAGIVEGRTVARDGLLPEVAAAWFRDAIALGEYLAWCDLERGEA